MRVEYRSYRSAAALLLLASLAACGGEKPAPDAQTDAAEAEAAPSAEAATPPPAPSHHPDVAPVTVEDIDRWQKGMAGELEAVKAATERMKAARNGEDSMSAMMAVQETSTREAGAKAAGVDVERYGVIRSHLSEATSYMTPELGGIDTTMLSQEQREEMKRLNESQLERMQETVPENVLEALRPRASELRKQELTLVGARLKGAGM
ncbi:MAG TPA: hypothetical protein VEB59_11045 [Gemmatimonadales bacterium]|nr:hypothetical protein [Gemmatimonadales bacterium]